MKMRKEILGVALTLLANHSLSGETPPEQTLPRPNILFIVVDDMGSWAMGNAGHPNAVTPNLDRLAREGATFRNHFSASAVCSPSRACLLTGKYSLETGVPDVLGKDEKIGLDLSQPTLPKAFQRAGYHTGLIGKWHLGHADRFYPTRFGYDVFQGFRIGGKEPPLSSSDPEIELNPSVKKVIKGYTSDILTDLAIDFIDHSRQPFFLSLHYWAPHANQGVSTADGDRTWLPLPEEDLAPFRDIDPVIPNPDYPRLDVARVKRMTREYLASVHGVDRNLGRIFQHLASKGILDRTIIVFTSDNGYNLGHQGIWHKGNGWWILTNNRGDRPNLYDQSMRVPALIRWPAKIPAGQEITAANSSLDWFPTLCGLAGVPTEAGWNLRGADLKETLAGQPPAPRPLFGQYRMWKDNQTGADLRAYRTEDWKLVVDLDKTVPNEFYDLRKDPVESTNLYDSKDPDIVAARQKMEGALRAYMAKIGDKRRKSAPSPKLEPVAP